MPRSPALPPICGSLLGAGTWFKGRTGSYTAAHFEPQGSLKTGRPAPPKQGADTLFTPLPIRTQYPGRRSIHLKDQRSVLPGAVSGLEVPGLPVVQQVGGATVVHGLDEGGGYRVEFGVRVLALGGENFEGFFGADKK